MLSARLGASWQIPPARILSMNCPISLQRGWQCGKDRVPEQGTSTDVRKREQRGLEPNPVFEKKVSLYNSNMLATGMESFQARSHSPQVYFLMAIESTLRVKVSETLSFLRNRGPGREDSCVLAFLHCSTDQQVTRDCDCLVCHYMLSAQHSSRWLSSIC